MLAVHRDDQLCHDFAGCTVTFDADLSALRNAIHQFGRVTTSESLHDALMISPSVPCRCSHSTDDQVPLLLKSSSTCLIAVSEHSGVCSGMQCYLSFEIFFSFYFSFSFIFIFKFRFRFSYVTLLSFSCSFSFMFYFWVSVLFRF